MNKFNLKLVHKGLILVLVPLGFELLFLIALTVMVNQAEAQVQQQVVSKQIMKLASKQERFYRDCARALNSYSLTGDITFLDQYLSAVELSRKSNLSFTEYSGISDLQRDVLKEIQEKSDHGIKLLDQAAQLAKQSPESARHLRSDALWQSILRLPNELDDATVRLDDSITKADLSLQHSSQQQKILLVGGVIFNIIMSLALAVFFSRDFVSRVLIIRENSLRLAAGQRLSGGVGGGDEIAELDRVFHRMASSLDEAARKERAIVDNAVDVICAVSSEFKFISVSPASQAAWGFAPEELIGKRLSDVLTDDSISEAIERFKTAMNTNEDLSLETKIKHRDGTLRHFTWSGAWSALDKTIFCVVHDMTEAKRIEQLKREFVAMVSHDLRAPLTSVQCFLEVLAEGVFRDDQDAVMQKARLSNTEISRLVQMVNSLLDVEKMEAGRMDVVINSVPIDRVVERAINSVSSLADHKKIRIAAGAGKELIADADEDLLVQILVNFLSNAIKFSPSGSEINVIANQDHDFTKICVADRGRGIPAEFSDKVFDRFEQVELADSRFKGGTGLGLAVCKAIVEAHEGEIGVDSVEGEGSTFWIKLPKKNLLRDTVGKDNVAVKSA